MATDIYEGNLLQIYTKKIWSQDLYVDNLQEGALSEDGRQLFEGMPCFSSYNKQQ